MDQIELKKDKKLLKIQMKTTKHFFSTFMMKAILHSC